MDWERIRTMNDNSNSFNLTGRMNLPVTEMGKTADGGGMEGR